MYNNNIMTVRICVTSKYSIKNVIKMHYKHSIRHAITTLTLWDQTAH